MATSERLHWGRSTVETACPLDCPDNCSLSVTVETGKVVDIDGSRQSPTTNGFICAKVRGFAGRVYHEGRVKHPQKRKGPKGLGQFERISWDEAYERIAQEIEKARDTWGGESILPFYYGGSNGILTQDSLDADLFRRLGASRIARTLCAAATTAAQQAMYGRMPGVGYEDYEAARLIVVWGANPSASGIHLVPFIKRAREKGAMLVVVDPRRTPLARQADLHVPVRPGTDLPVALALVNYLFEHGHADTAFLDAHAVGAAELKAAAAGWSLERAAAIAQVDVAVLERFAGLYAGTSPAVIRCGWGLERNRNGGSAVLAVLALPAVAGKFGVRGGGYTLSNSAAYGLQHKPWVTAPEPQTRLLNMNRLGRALTEPGGPPIAVLYVYNANPVATLPDQQRVIRGLSREEIFTVVHEQVMTDTARYADIVLPATTFLEHYDVSKGYGSYSVQLVKPVIDVIGESKPNVEVFARLSSRLGLTATDEADEGEAIALMAVAETLPEVLRDKVLTGEPAMPEFGTRPVLFVDVFPNTPDRKVHLFPADVASEAPAGLYGYQADPASPEFPLALISPASEKTISSTLGELRQKPASLAIHPEDAATRAIEDGDAVRIHNTLGEVHCLAAVTPKVPRGVVSLPKGLWQFSTLNGATGNALVPDSLTDIGAGACFNDARVEVTRIVGAEFGPQRLSFWVDGATPRQ
jgi:anaerobic selenocysteine-containing dehydrogenase